MVETQLCKLRGASDAFVWKIERRKSGGCGEVLNRWSTGDGGKGDQFGESAVEL